MSTPTDRDNAVALTRAAASECTRSAKSENAGSGFAVDMSRADRDRALVMRHFRGLVDSGVAKWVVMEGGHIRLSLNSGAVFELGLTEVTRIA